LLLCCSYSREIWYRLLLASTISLRSIHWDQRMDFDSLVVLVCWSLWRERNARVFNKVQLPAPELLATIRGVARIWIVVGFVELTEFLT
jgi:hypothetical protein